MNSGKILLGVLAGVAAGALIGVLFAPDKGWNTRKRISKKVDEYKDGLRDKFNEFLDTITEKMEEAKNEVSDLNGQDNVRKTMPKKEPKTATG